MRMGMGGIGGMGMIVGFLISLAVAAVLILLAVLAIIALVKYIKATGKQGEAKTISVNGNISVLDERYAKGEIDDEEYARRKENLRKQ